MKFFARCFTGAQSPSARDTVANSPVDALRASNVQGSLHSAKDLLAAFESVDMKKTKKQSTTKPFGKFAKFMCWKKPSTKNTITNEDDEEIVFTRLPSEASLVLESPKRRTSDASLKIAAAFFHMDRPSLPATATMDEEDFSIAAMQSPAVISIPTMLVEEKNATPPPATAAAVLWPAGWTRPFTAPIRPEELENAYMAPGCKVTASEFAAGQFIITVGDAKVDEIIFLPTVSGLFCSNTSIPATLDAHSPAIVEAAEEMLTSEVVIQTNSEAEIEEVPQVEIKATKRVFSRLLRSFGRTLAIFKAPIKAALLHKAPVKLHEVEFDTPDVSLPRAVLAIKAKRAVNVTASWTGFAASFKALAKEAVAMDEVVRFEMETLINDTKEILKLCVEVLGLSSLLTKTPMARPFKPRARSTACTLALTPASLCVPKVLLQLEGFPELNDLSPHIDEGK